MALLKTKLLDINRQLIAQLLNDIVEVYDKAKRAGFVLWYYTQAIRFAEGDVTLVQEYKKSFQAGAKRAIDVLRTIQKVHVLEFE